MRKTSMTSIERTLTTLGHKEPDRVPLFLLLTMHGAKELGMTIKEYFSKAENVVEGQLILQEKYNNDCIYSLFYAPVENEAFGGEVIFIDDGPPNSGEPIIRKFRDIDNLKVPDIARSACLQKVLSAIEKLKSRVKDEIPIIGVAMSPFSLPVMQMGFENYFLLMIEEPAMFDKLMQINMAFCTNWANAQLAAGATAICYFDPVSSPTIIPRELYLKTGFPIAKTMIKSIKGPTATHMASGSVLPIVDDLAETGTAIVGVSVLENLTDIKAACKNKLTVLGNLNGIEMRKWTADEAEKIVKETIAQGAAGGGFILSDNHGEIPWQVSEEVLFAISEANRKWGTYPLDWLKNE